MKNSVEINSLNKSYGKFSVLKNVNLNVREGSIFGLIGPNGAGKTTLIKAMVGALKINSGEISVLGKNPLKNSWELRRQVGYMPQTPSLYGDLSARQNISFFGKAQNIPGLEKEVEKILEFTELTDRANDPVRNFSGGMQKRVSLACALIHSPKIIFLDEPTAAVDPHLKKRSWELFKKLSGQGITIFVSTHLMDEALLCDTISILRAGEVLAIDTPQNFLARGNSKIKYEKEGNIFELVSGSDPASLAIQLKKLGLEAGITKIEIIQDNIESIVLQMTDKK
ncbi:MAG TPA: ABC transporter ATP-binding protein [Bacteroidia bacterium]|jgi:ABC-2 type transport system ATP-binding protein|nr:ABC transporter ATP-binding protein [Bacteroidia bacterium]